MRIVSLMTCWLFAACSIVQGQSANVFEERQTTAANMRLTVNNLGMIGNAFRGSFTSDLGYSSCEYPAGSNIEHLFQGGLWIGAQVDGVPRVTTGGYDDPNGYAPGDVGYEFTPDGFEGLTERSNELGNPLYASDAVSNQDFLSRFTDRNIEVPGTEEFIPEHVPINADVQFQAYNWNFTFVNFMTILNYTITNNGTQTWNNVHLGYWCDPVIRNLQQTPAGAGGSGFYNKSGTGYIDSLYAGYEFDATGDVGFTESYFALKFLGAESNGQLYRPDIVPGFLDHFHSWGFRNTDNADVYQRTPGSDVERFDRMSLGANRLEDWEDRRNDLKEAGNRSQLLSVGSFGDVAPGESISIAFAVVCARKNEDGNPNTADTPEQKANLVSNLQWAQSAFNGEDLNGNGILDAGEDANENGVIDRYTLPEPPPSPVDTVIAEQNTIRIYWSDNAESFEDPISNEVDFEGYRIYKTPKAFELNPDLDLDQQLSLIAQYDKKENSGMSGEITEYNNGFDEIRLEQPVTFEGSDVEYHYMFELKNASQGWQHAMAVTAFDRGQAENNVQPLESSPLVKLKRVFTGTPANKDFENGDPYVYPNPYYAGAAWEQSETREQNRKLYFANLPPRCDINVYTVSGELVYSVTHDAGTGAQSTDWYETFASVDGQETRVFSGGEHAWNLLSADEQILSRGIYLFAVKDLDSGTVRKGKFVVIR